MYDHDVIIIGGGVSGCAAARELSRYKVDVCVLEKEEDVCCGTSKANSGIVHAGYDAPAGSLKAEMNLRGNEMMERLSEELDIPFIRNGSLVLCMNEKDMPKLEALYDRGIANGVKGLQILNKEAVLKKEPNVSKDVYAALYAPTGGIVCPFELNIALAENACMNGVRFHFQTEVQKIERQEEGYKLSTDKGDFSARYVVNAAGVYADQFHNMVSADKIHITARRGDYCLLDKSAGNHVRSTIFTLPGEFGKGILAAPTAHGNLILGPTAIDIEDKEGTNTTRDGLSQVLDKAGMSVSNLPMRQVITSFAGLRAHEDGEEFIIEEVSDAPGFIAVSNTHLLANETPEHSVCR
ncbi:MAG: NAD(P)/FAD-dependent oxidoreductase, partial [Lachnospiraceae bacterium]|nr:NAD(P)/FAD-dependent oxidoreductase [Lachnospiraceae bacterium]